ncbi:MAG: hypothetical protein H0T76_12565 [Nannocystis sp.]|nr:hypothetical protein [Nannocystis sp.]MBA3547311.1 hypothetical protein [Nannocystis sp.]
MLVVTGTRRSGTSMWMQILAAAGLPIIGEAFPGDWSETLREANPHGFYECLLRHGVYYRTNPHPLTGEFVLPEQVRRHAVKVFIPGVIRSDRVYLDRVLVTVRPWREYEASILRLYALEDRNQVLAGGGEVPARMPPALEWWDENFALIRDIAVRGYACHVQSYDGVLADPRRVIGAVLEWFGEGGDLEAALRCVRPEVRTQRAPVSSSVTPEHAAVFDDFYAAVDRGEGLDRGLIARMNRVHQALGPEIQEHHERIAATHGLLYRSAEERTDDGPFMRLTGEWA